MFLTLATSSVLLLTGTVKAGEYKLSKSIKTISSEAFKDNPLLRNLIVPDTLGTIGDNAFYNAIQSGYHCKDVTVTFYYVNGEIAANILIKPLVIPSLFSRIF